MANVYHYRDKIKKHENSFTLLHFFTFFKKVLPSPLSPLQLFGDGGGLSVVSEVLTKPYKIMLVNSIYNCKALHFLTWKLRLQNLRDRLLFRGKA